MQQDRQRSDHATSQARLKRRGNRQAVREIVAKVRQHAQQRLHAIVLLLARTCDHKLLIPRSGLRAAAAIASGGIVALLALLALLAMTASMTVHRAATQRAAETLQRVEECIAQDDADADTSAGAVIVHVRVR